MEKLNELSSTVTNLLTQVNDLSTVVTLLSQHLTQLLDAPGYSLSPNATLTQLTCSDLYYLDDQGYVQDLEQELLNLKSIDTSHACSSTECSQSP